MLSVTSSTRVGRFSASNPRMTAVISMRLLVLSRSRRCAKFLAGGRVAEDEGPAAGPRVAAARAVGKELHFRRILRSFLRHCGSIPSSPKPTGGVRWDRKRQTTLLQDPFPPDAAGGLGVHDTGIRAPCKAATRALRRGTLASGEKCPTMRGFLFPDGDERMDGDPSAATIGLLLSGGLDSSILLGHLLAGGRRVQPFYVRGALRWEADEQRQLAGCCGRGLAAAGELVMLDLPLADLYGDHWSLTGRGVPEFDSPDTAVYLPGRNALLLIKPALWCRLHGIEELALAVLGANPFADATAEFFAEFAGAAGAGRRRPRPHPPPLRPAGKAAGHGVGPRPALGVDLLLHRAGRADCTAAGATSAPSGWPPSLPSARTIRPLMPAGRP